MADSDDVSFRGLLAERVANDGQDAAAEVLGVTQSLVSRYIAGISVPRDDKVPGLARFLERSEDEVALLLSKARRKKVTDAERITALEVQMVEVMRRLDALADRWPDAPPSAPKKRR